MNRPTRFRTVITSAIKHDYVARGVASHPRYHILAVCDDADIPVWAHERNQLLADELGVPYYREIESTYRNHRAEVAVVSSEAARHARLSQRAATMGLHVIQDKPLALDMVDAVQLQETIRANGTSFMMWNRNGLPAVVSLKRQVESGIFGQILAMHCDFYFAKDAGPPKGERRPGYPPMNWLAHQIAAHVDGSDGGLGEQPIGELANEGIYPLGYLFAVTQARPMYVFASACAHFHQLNADNGVEDLATMTLHLSDRSLATISLGRIGLASHPSGGDIRIRVVGSKANTVIREASPDIAIHYRNQPVGEPRQRRVGVDNDFLLADAFAKAIDSRTQPMMGIDDSLVVLRTVQAALRSIQSGRLESVE